MEPTELLKHIEKALNTIPNKKVGDTTTTYNLVAELSKLNKRIDNHELILYKENIIPNWYNIKNLSKLAGEKISKKKFQEFKGYVEENLCESLSYQIEDMWDEFTRRKK